MADIKEKTAEEFRRRLDDKDERLYTAEEQLKKEYSFPTWLRINEQKAVP